MREIEVAENSEEETKSHMVSTWTCEIPFMPGNDEDSNEKT